MIAFLLGAGIGLGLHHLTGQTWLLAIGCWVVALPLQSAYARTLAVFIGGVDPVARYGARNLSELRRVVPIPLSIVMLSFLARTLGWAGGMALSLLLTRKLL